MSIIENAAIKSAAQKLAQAEADKQQADQQHIAAKATLDQIDSRMTALREKRSGIIAASRQGQHNQQHGLDLAVVDADLEDLAKLIPEADAAVITARGQQEAAKNALEAAHYQLQQAEAKAAEAQLVEHAGKLEGLMLETIRRLDAVRKALGGGRPVWAPSPAIVGEFTRLRLQKGV